MSIGEPAVNVTAGPIDTRAPGAAAWPFDPEPEAILAAVRSSFAHATVPVNGGIASSSVRAKAPGGTDSAAVATPPLPDSTVAVLESMPDVVSPTAQVGSAPLFTITGSVAVPPAPASVEGMLPVKVAIPVAVLAPPSAGPP